MLDPGTSLATDLRLVAQAYRNTKHHGGSRAHAEAAALHAYCSLHPDVSDADASAAVARIIRATSEAGMIWLDS